MRGLQYSILAIQILITVWHKCIVHVLQTEHCLLHFTYDLQILVDSDYSSLHDKYT